jgi:hypothetical protein
MTTISNEISALMAKISLKAVITAERKMYTIMREV